MRIATYPKKYVEDVYDYTFDNVNFWYIASCLNNEPRWQGRTVERYSVLDHTALCVQLARAQGWSDDRKTMVAILLHDAPEAYLKDLPYPMRQESWMLPFNQADSFLQGTLLDLFGIDMMDIEVMDRVTAVDQTAAYLESRYFFPGDKLLEEKVLPGFEVEPAKAMPRCYPSDYVSLLEEYKTMIGNSWLENSAFKMPEEFKGHENVLIRP